MNCEFSRSARSYTARNDAACRLANGILASLGQYWPTLMVKESPSVGTRTSNTRASAGTLPKGRCTDSA